jgi:propanol-preferring alcohol dehydrogenase
MPEFSYDMLWRERAIRSVANFTRADGREFLDLAASIPVRADVEAFDLREAPAVLERLAEGRISGSAVLIVRPT